MKTRKIKLLGLLLVGLIAGCQSPSIKITEPSPSEIEQIKAIGEDVSNQLTNTLQMELKAAIAEGGFQKAIEVCNIRAIPLTESLKENQNLQLGIKRTSYKYRNPVNAPDSVEKLALDHFITLFNENEEIPEYYIQKITDSKESWFCFYKPIRVGHLCLGCHGQTPNIDSSIINQLAKLYPDDKAVGYAEGDFRGLISVTIRE